MNLRKYYQIPSQKFTNIPDSTQRKLIHGYYACVSYVDKEIHVKFIGVRDALSQEKEEEEGS